MTKRSKCLLFVIALLACRASTVGAETITWNYYGTGTERINGSLGTTTFAATLTVSFDTATPNLFDAPGYGNTICGRDVSNQPFGFYYIAAQLTVGSLVSPLGGFIEVNDELADLCAPLRGVMLVEQDAGGIGRSLYLGFPHAPDSAALPTTQPLAGGGFYLDPRRPGTSYDIQLLATPEPASLFLLGTGLLGVIAAIRRRRI